MKNSYTLKGLLVNPVLASLVIRFRYKPGLYILKLKFKFLGGKVLGVENLLPSLILMGMS